LAFGGKRNGAGVKGELYLAAEIEVVDQVVSTVTGKENDGATVIEVDPYFNDPVIEVAHGCVLGDLSGSVRRMEHRKSGKKKRREYRRS
jgi:hypothetical protein